jgi:hypothetical protein
MKAHTYLPVPGEHRNFSKTLGSRHPLTPFFILSDRSTIIYFVNRFIFFIV